MAGGTGRALGGGSLVLADRTADRAADGAATGALASRHWGGDELGGAGLTAIKAPLGTGALVDAVIVAIGGAIASVSTAVVISAAALVGAAVIVTAIVMAAIVMAGSVAVRLGVTLGLAIIELTTIIVGTTVITTVVGATLVRTALITAAVTTVGVALSTAVPVAQLDAETRLSNEDTIELTLYVVGIIQVVDVDKGAGTTHADAADGNETIYLLP